MQLTLNPSQLKESFETMPLNTIQADIQTPQATLSVKMENKSGNHAPGAPDSVSKGNSRNKKALASTQSSISLIKPAAETKFSLDTQHHSRKSSISSHKKYQIQHHKPVRKSPLRTFQKNAAQVKMPIPRQIAQIPRSKQSTKKLPPDSGKNLEAEKLGRCSSQKKTVLRQNNNT